MSKDYALELYDQIQKMIDDGKTIEMATKTLQERIDNHKKIGENLEDNGWNVEY